MEFALWAPVPVILVFGFMGFRDGVVRRLLEIVGILASIVLAGRFATDLLPWMTENTGLPEGAALFLTWAGLFLVGFLLSKLVAAFVSKLLRLTILGWVDRWGGAVLGATVGILFCSVILVAISQVGSGRSVQQTYEKHPWSRFLFHAAPNLYRQVQGMSGGRADEAWHRVLDEAKDQVDQAAENVKEATTDAASEAAGDALKDGVDGARDQVEEKLEEAKEAAGG